MRMISGGVALAAMLPGVLMAQDKAAMCVTVLQAIEAADAALDDMTDAQGDATNEMIAMRERIGGQDGAAVEAKALSHLDDYLAHRREVSDATGEARAALMAYCVPQ